MAKCYSLKIVTPREIFYQGEVSSLVLPGNLGSFGVLCNHAPIIAALDAGPVKMINENGEELRYDIGSGYFDMYQNSAVIITESIKPAVK